MFWQHAAGHNVRESVRVVVTPAPRTWRAVDLQTCTASPMCHPIWLLTAVCHAMTATICRSSPSRAHSLSARDTLIESKP